MLNRLSLGTAVPMDIGDDALGRLIRLDEARVAHRSNSLPGGSGMSTYGKEKALWDITRDKGQADAFRADAQQFLSAYQIDPSERLRVHLT